ncbi:hypothetical protein GCM10023091_18830 [Ravibacter arvi]|uniref:Oxygen sensor histidine kinase NreB n=1 Tax=Ravibacter arvi TaxID=2051041 RepID=A0ABP8LYP7_9BACT
MSLHRHFRLFPVNSYTVQSPLLTFLALLIPLALSGRSEADSLRALIAGSREDSAKVHLLYRYGELFEGNRTDSAAFYYWKARKLAEDIGYSRGVAVFASHYIVILNNEGKFREALKIAQEALELFKKTGDKNELATAYLNVGSEWQYLSDLSTASSYYLLSKKYAEETGNLRLQRISNNNLASVFIQLNEFEKGKAYAETALILARKLKNEYAVASSMFNIATAWTQLKRPDKALPIYQEVRRIGEKEKDDGLQLDGWIGIAEAYRALSDETAAEEYYKRVINYSQNRDIPEYKMYACLGLGDLLLNSGRRREAASYLADGLMLARKMGSNLELKDFYLKMSLLHEKEGDFVKALDFRKQFEVLHDSIVGEKSRAEVSNLEARYEFEKKEGMIRQLKASVKVRQLLLKRKSLFNYLLAGGSLGLLTLLLLLYRNYQAKQKIQRHRIAELEAEKKLTITEALLKGEEQERSRLAKDLHDGLGGMLSGVKLSLSRLKNAQTLLPGDQHTVGRSLDMLDSSIHEMRRLARNLMPESLVRFGLNAALCDFCTDLNRSGAITVSYQSFGMENATINQKIGISVYRIVQELFNNILKHAHADAAIVQISLHDALLSITVEDDGVGFVPAESSPDPGMGLKNIRSRVEFLGGKIDLRSSQGNGTSVLIEIPT